LQNHRLDIDRTTSPQPVTTTRHHNRKRRNKYSVKPAQMAITPITIKNE